MRKRWYDSNLGVWLSPDPIGFTAGSNLYRYCFNNPVRYTDANGMQPHDDPPTEEDYKARSLSGQNHGDHLTPHQVTTWGFCSVACPGVYNCHSYSLTDSQRDPDPTPAELEWARRNNFDHANHAFNLDPFDDLKSYRKLGPSEAVQKGDIILYGVDVDKSGSLNVFSPEVQVKINAISEATHTGVVETVVNGKATRIWSKWGSGFLTFHHPCDVPKDYGTMREYWRKK
jgi:hypothetical protein